MGVSKNNGTPESSILIGFSIIFTIHLVGFPLFLGWHLHKNSPKAYPEGLSKRDGRGRVPAQLAMEASLDGMVVWFKCC